jgi:environmental stress-induced protein Ves
MNAQLSMFDVLSREKLYSATSSQASVSGTTRFALQGGRITVRCGLALVVVGIPERGR